MPLNLGDDIASIGQGLLSGVTSSIGLMDRARRLQLAEDTLERQRLAEARAAQRDAAAHAIKLAELAFKGEEVIRQDPTAAPRVAAVLKQFGLDFTPNTAGLEAEQGLITSGRAKLARFEVPTDEEFEAMTRWAARTDKTGTALKNLQDAYRGARASRVLGDYSAGALSRDQAARELALLGHDPGKVFGPAYAEDVARAQGRGRERGKIDVLSAPVEAPAGPPIAGPTSIFGVDLTLDRSGLGGTEGAAAPPSRTGADVLADLEAKKARARITPLDLRRVEAQERQTGAAERRAAAAEMGAETGRLEHQRRLAKDREVRERLNATIKTLEAQAVDIAKRQFPDDPVKQRALTEWLQQRVRWLAALSASDKSAKSAAELEAEIQAQVKQLRGELAEAFPEVKPAREAQWWNPFSWFSSGSGAKPGTSPAAPRGLPARPRSTPEPTAEVFDPYGSGYDYATARRSGITPDATGHYPSRLPLSNEEADRLGVPRGSGLILKGRKHPTYQKTVEGEAAAGFELREVTEGPLKGRVISVPKASGATQQSPVHVEALKAARDALVNALYPGRVWSELTRQEKQQVLDRLNR